MTATNSAHAQWGSENVNQHHPQDSRNHCVWATAHISAMVTLATRNHSFPLADCNTHDVILGSLASETRAPFALHHTTRPTTVAPFCSHPTSSAGMTTRSCRQGTLQAQQGCRPQFWI